MNEWAEAEHCEVCHVAVERLTPHLCWPATLRNLLLGFEVDIEPSTPADPPLVAVKMPQGYRLEVEEVWSPEHNLRYMISARAYSPDGGVSSDRLIALVDDIPTAVVLIKAIEERESEEIAEAEHEAQQDERQRAHDEYLDSLERDNEPSELRHVVPIDADDPVHAYRNDPLYALDPDNPYDHEVHGL